MKRMFTIIIVLALIFIGMIVYKNTAVGSKNDVNVNEIEEIQEYIYKIYMWREVTNEALPAFEDVNNADKLWIWEVVKRNSEQYEMSYKEIEDKAKEIFGESFSKEFPKEGTSSLEYNEETDKYLATETVLDEQEDDFLLSNIDKTNNGYVVEIIEYLEDYSEGENVKVLNLDNEEIGKMSTNESESQIQDIVKENKDKFSKKKIYLRKENDKLVIEKVEKE